MLERSEWQCYRDLQKEGEWRMAALQLRLTAGGQQMTDACAVIETRSRSVADGLPVAALLLELAMGHVLPWCDLQQEGGR